MAKYRDKLPQLDTSRYFITDGGLETSMIYKHGAFLPEFAAFVLLNDSYGINLIEEYFKKYINIALHYDVGLQLESPTWRASYAWGEKLGYSKDQLDRVNHKAIEMFVSLREQYETPEHPFVISGCIGPVGDAYSASEEISISDSKAYHLNQISTFSETQADMVSAYTIPEYKEAIGIALAAKESNIPVIIGFTLETDGQLPSGQSLKEAIELVDQTTDNYVSYYMVNCVHPNHMLNILKPDGIWKQRIQSVRVNASCKSHAELDVATELDEGDAAELGREYASVKALLPCLNVVGGCCGTDHRHVESIISNLILVDPLIETPIHHHFS